jgi:RNA polymerase sigma-70 factor (family 1)
MSTVSDKTLFGRIAEGDQDAFSAIYLQYAGTLHFYALKLLKSPAWAEEVVQEIFLQLWSSRAKLTQVENPAAYLNRMTLHKAIDWMRKHHRVLSIEYYQHHFAGTDANFTEEQLDFKLCESLYYQAINELPPQQKIIYKMKNEDHLSNDQIADQLNLSKNTVRNHLSRSVEAIRTYLLKHGDMLSPLIWLFWLNA